MERMFGRTKFYSCPKAYFAPLLGVQEEREEFRRETEPEKIAVEALCPEEILALRMLVKQMFIISEEMEESGEEESWEEDDEYAPGRNFAVSIKFRPHSANTFLNNPCLRGLYDYHHLR